MTDTNTTITTETDASIRLDERLRIAAILESPEGLARPTQALHLAMKTNMDPVSANELLATMPEANPFEEAMSRNAIGIAGGSKENANGNRSESAKEKRLAEIAQVGKTFNATKGFVAKT
jgi:hypothetical protein